MTDVELSSLLNDLQNSANQLNAETGSVNSMIECIEDRLRGMNLGLECWLTGDYEALESKNPSADSLVQIELGFAKVAGEWCLSIREAKYQKDRQSGGWYQVGDAEPGKLKDASRDIRIGALKRLSSLLDALKKRADEDTASIRGAKKVLGW